jgi:hypothetical protein
MASRRLNFDDLLAEQRKFIGPSAPPQIPKFTPKAEREAVQAMLLDERAARMAAQASAHKGRS